MLAMSIFFPHATAGLLTRFLCLLKVLCLSFARLRPSYALDPYVSDLVTLTKAASDTLLNRSIKCKRYSSNAVKIGNPKLLNDLQGSLS